MPIIPSSNPGSKAISLGGTQTCGSYNQSIEKELSGPGTASISINCSSVRSLLGKPSGSISFSCAYGKSSFPGKIAILAIGGGGAGGAFGGGGAGGFRTLCCTGVAGNISYCVTIGSGGAGGLNPIYGGYAAGCNGGDTTVHSPTIAITAYGGGGGGSSGPPTSLRTTANGYPGPGAGYGGGGVLQVNNFGGGSAPGGLGTFTGGGAYIAYPATIPQSQALGGGGAGASGQAQCAQICSAGTSPTAYITYHPATGANGLQWVDGNYYAGGGGGNAFYVSGIPTTILDPTHGSGGLGGGGAGAYPTPTGGVSAFSGSPGTGGGGGGGTAGGGGPGVVKFIYSSPTQLGTGGTVTNVSSLPGSPIYPAPVAVALLGSGPYWIHTFTSPGTFIT